FNTTASLRCSDSNKRGINSIAFSGQVVSHRPHCTQFFSIKRNCGNCGLSFSALAGHALTQLMHSVQASALTAIAPKGEPLPGTPPGKSICGGNGSGAQAIK